MMNAKEAYMLLRTPCVLYDMGRLVQRAMAPAPTGIDRIDLQVAHALSSRLGDRFLPLVRQGRSADLLPSGLARAFLDNLQALWCGNEKLRPATVQLAKQMHRVTRRLVPHAMLLRQIRQRTGGQPITYVCCSHSGLAAAGPELLSRLQSELRMHSLIYVHDLIPLEFPEYSRPEATARFRRMLRIWMSLHPLQIMVNSRHTATQLRTWLSSNGLDLGRDTIHVAPPVVDWVPDRSSLPPPALKIDTPYFVIIGTIEPRKNHLLLLHLWRDWIKRSSRVPKLLIIGKRGWENDVVFNMLDRCEVLRGHVMELGALPQKEMFALLAGARALLMPSFAEGLGLPVLEAISMGVPVLASDIPAFQEIGDAKGIALFHPLDMRAWQKHIAIQAR